MKPAITMINNRCLSKFLINPLMAALLAVSALATSTAAIASECSCHTNSLPTLTIEDSNHSHPNQLTLKSDKSYYQLLAPNGQIIQERLYMVTPYENGQILAKRDGRVGLIDADGQLLFDFAYDDIKILPDNLYLLSNYQGAQRRDALVRGADDWLYPPSSKFENNVNLEPLYHDQTNSISYLKVTQNGKVGLISDKKQTLIASVYDELGLLDTCPNERLFMSVRAGDKVGLIDQYQKMVVPLEAKQTIENFNQDEQIFKVSKTNYSSYYGNDSFISDTLIKGNGKTLLHSDSPITSLSNGWYQFSQAGSYGVINAAADILVPAIFENISSHWDAPIIVTKDGKQGILRADKTTKQLVVSKYYDQLQSVDVTDQSLAQLQAAVADEQEVDSASDEDFSTDAAYADEAYVDEDLYSKDAEIVAEAALAQAEYDANTAEEDVLAAEALEALETDDGSQDYYFEPRLYIAKLNGKFGLIDAQDTVKIPFLYDEISESAHALLVKKVQKHGLLTAQNETIAGVVYDSIDSLEHTDTGLIYVLSLDNQQRIIDSAGHPLLPLSSYRMAAIDAESYGLDNRIIANSAGMYGLLSANFDSVLLAPNYEKIERELANHYILAQKDGKKVLIDNFGQQVATDLSEYTEIDEWDATNTLLVTKDNGKQGLISNEGKIVVEPKYDNIDPVILGYYTNDDRAYSYMVESVGYYGLLSHTGKTIIKPKYRKMTPLYYSKYLVVSDPKSAQEEPKFGLVNSQGGVVKGFNYDVIYESDYNNYDEIVLIMIAKDTVEIYNNKLTLIQKMSLQQFKQQEQDS